MVKGRTNRRNKARKPVEESVSEYRRIREIKYGTLRQAASRTKLSASLIQKLEANATRPRPGTIQKYANLLGKTKDEVHRYFYP